MDLSGLENMVYQQLRARPVVLVVEDEEIIRMLACEMLADEGYRVLDAANASDAMRILDDGLQLAREVHRRWPGVRLLVTSGGQNLTDQDIPDDGRFLSKPCSGASLRTGMRSAIEQG